jgi:L-seryl-tRNA(Ser) seleniumtransferase
VRETLKTGIDLVTFSGDKLLGGPQAGIIVGKQSVIDKVRKHPMARALRIDKLTLAALEATLRLYLDPQEALEQVPALRMLSLPVTELQECCERLLPRLTELIGDAADCSIIEATATVGGGALPLAELPGRVIALVPKDMSLNELTTRLRSCEPAVIGRIQDDRFLIDPRTLNADDEALLLQALQQVFSQNKFNAEALRTQRKSS